MQYARKTTSALQCHTIRYFLESVAAKPPDSPLFLHQKQLFDLRTVSSTVGPNICTNNKATRDQYDLLILKKRKLLYHLLPHFDNKTKNTCKWRILMRSNFHNQQVIWKCRPVAIVYNKYHSHLCALSFTWPFDVWLDFPELQSIQTFMTILKVS